MTSQPPVSPDCSNAPFKCAACSGDAWDDVADEMTPCTCPCHAPTPREPVCDHVIRPRIAPGVEQCQLCGALLDEPASRRSLLDPERKDHP